MFKVGVLGKLYQDTILVVHAIAYGDTNECSTIIKKSGGMYNLSELSFLDLKFNYIPIGIKNAFIISNKLSSERTSFVINEKESDVSHQTILKINKNNDWLHISYIDDIEKYENILSLDIPFSLDFCTLKNRTEYLQIIKKADVIFDSRERRSLYSNLNFDTPLILHDSGGIEIIANDRKIYQESISPIENLNVNGAGDIFAGLFIKNYLKNDLKTSAYNAMINTTKILIERNKNEKI